MTDQNLVALDARLAPAKMMLKEALKSNSISKDTYHQNIVRIAYEYAVAGYVDETLMLVLGIDPNYFLGPSTLQMKQDSEFERQARIVAETLMSVGFFPTMRPANA